jgi:hypothetical protein
MKENCKICKQELKGPSLTCSKGTICMKCAGDISLAEFQPAHSLDSILWCLAETFFRKGKGEEINFEKVWSEGDNLKLIKFDELYFKRFTKDGNKC